MYNVKFKYKKEEAIITGPNDGTIRYASQNSKVVEKQYDEAFNYDSNLTSMGYRGPEDGAKIMKKFVPTTYNILDAGCGTGLTGLYLNRQGYDNIVGCDISSYMLKKAKEKGIYKELLKVDLNLRLLPFKNEQFDSVYCIGVLLHIKKVEMLLREFCRIIKTNGYVVFSQRNDFIEIDSYDDILRKIEKDLLWKKRFSSDYMSYIPGHEGYSDKIKVKYFVYKVN